MDTSTIQGRQIGRQEVEQVRGLLGEHGNWSRHRLSQHLARLWNWRNPAGQLKDMAARTLLLKLEQRGWIQLPARRQVSPSRMRLKGPPAMAVAQPSTPIAGALHDLLPLSVRELSRQGAPGERAFFDALLIGHHYLSHRGTVGENLKYLAYDRQGRPVACLLFGAAAWQCQSRDQHIGWNAPTRQRR